MTSLMTCDVARDALLDADLPIADEASELARHLRECDACTRVATAVARDMASLRVAVRHRARRHMRVVTVAAATTLAAAAVVVTLVRLSSRVAHVPPAVNAAASGIVSVQVPPGKTATVLQTKDPNVTVVWLSNEAGGGL